MRIHNMSYRLHQLQIIFGLFLALCSTPVSAAIITDSEGNVIDCHVPFTRIISLYPAHTENLISLGVQDRLVGISTGDLPVKGLGAAKRFSYRDDPEKFIAQRPDLVLIRPMISRSYPGLVKHLQRVGITVCSLQPRTIEEMFVYWQTLGKLTDSEKRAKQMVEIFKNRLTFFKQKVENIPITDRPKVYFEAIHSRMKTFSPTSMAIFCLEKAGGINIAKDAKPRNNTNIATYGKERILTHAGEIDVFLAQKGRMNPVSMAAIIEEPGFKAIKAVRENRVFLVEEYLVSRPTMRLLEGIEQISRLLYPNL